MLKRSAGQLFWILGIYAVFVWGRSSTEEVFEENLALRPLGNSKVLARFSFTTTLQDAVPRSPHTLQAVDTPQHYNIFPLALGQILREYAVTEMHLTLNAGKWNYNSWGYPEEAGVASGAELWAWMGDEGQSTLDDRWRGLQNSLSGLFCASLGSMDDQRTTSPVLAFTPEGDLPPSNAEYHVRHASLPSENVCTENLTPFLKLLPCKSSAGIASLLNPHRLFDADWHGMGIHALWRDDKGVQIRLSFQAVLNPNRASDINNLDWSLQSLFARDIRTICPVSTSSVVTVKLPTSSVFDLQPHPSRIEDGWATFELSSIVGTEVLGGVKMRLNANIEETSKLYPTVQSQLSVERSLKGTSQDHAQVVVTVTNSAARHAQAIYLETMPWLLQLYLHSLRVEVDGVLHATKYIVSDMSYLPPVFHGRPATLQFLLNIPPQASVRLTMEATKSFLRYTEHPPDAQRGWDLPPGVLVPLEEKSDRHHLTSIPLNAISDGRMYTSILLVDLATPDFSMPYNVIIMSCTLVAMIFGTIFNLLTRRFVVVKITAEQA